MKWYKPVERKIKEERSERFWRIKEDLPSYEFTWTGRQGNELAHHITALARTNRLSPNWTYNIPSSVKAILQQDRIGIRNERLKGDDCLSAVLRCDVTGAVDG